MKLAVHWPNFGPYHVARLSGIEQHLSSKGISLTGLEIAGEQRTYAWEKYCSANNFIRKIVFPDRCYEEVLAHPFILFDKVWKVLNSVDPDLIAVNGYSTLDSLVIIFWAKLHSKKLILMSESKESDQKRGVLKEAIKKIIVSQFSAAICGGALHRDYLISLGMSPQKIFMGYDVVDNHYFHGKAIEIRRNSRKCFDYIGLEDNDRPFFLASARFIPRKNILGLVKAFGKYKANMQRKEKYPWRLIILGDGEQRPAIEEAIRDNHLGSDVYLAGLRQIEEIPYYYALANVFIHPAIQEQWGLVVNEAMASGLPVLISRNCGCTPDLLKEGVNGFSFDPSNIDELTKLMEKISSGLFDLNAMGRASEEIIKDWGPERFANALYAVLVKATNFDSCSDK